jgi:hypothetical protein
MKAANANANLASSAAEAAEAFATLAKFMLSTGKTTNNLKKVINNSRG